MDRTERFYRIDQLLHDRRVVPVSAFLGELGISLATFKRDMEYLRSRLHAPIVWDRERRGYRFDEAPAAGPRYELPGLWFSPSEAQALLTMQELLEGLQPGLLGPHLRPLLSRLKALLTTGDHSAEEVRRRIRVIGFGSRRHEPKHFEQVASAVLGRKRLRIRYYNRASDETTEREVSPQRLVHYRNNWYLDAWCHLRNDLRSFALDAMRSVKMTPTAARDVPDAELDAVLKSGYGIFSGRTVQWATLRFTAERARYVSLEEWHPRQRARFEADGSYLLEVPFNSPKELLMDILRFGPEVEVLAPPRLRELVAASLAAASSRYSGARVRSTHRGKA
jgi:predicted DNA-binding transcriptional regulator YafY